MRDKSTLSSYLMRRLRVSLSSWFLVGIVEIQRWSANRLTDVYSRLCVAEKWLPTVYANRLATFHPTTRQTTDHRFLYCNEFQRFNPETPRGIQDGKTACSRHHRSV